MVLLHLQVRSKCICNPRTSITRIRGASKTTPSFQRWTPLTGADKLASTYLPQGQAPRFPHAGLKYLVHLDSPIMIEWTIVVGCIKNEVHRKVTHPSTTLALGSLTLELPWDPALNHPLLVECTPITLHKRSIAMKTITLNPKC